MSNEAQKQVCGSSDALYGALNGVSQETLGEHIDDRISRLESEIARLRAFKDIMSDVLHMRVHDVRAAAGW